MLKAKNWVHLGLAAMTVLVFGALCSAQTVSCSSDDGHRHYCSADTRGGARMVNQRSQSACREGYSWGTDSRGIWVDHGCRADFEVGRGGEGRSGRDDSRRHRGNYGGQEQTVSCSSDDGHRHYCSANTQGGVRMQNQRSESACREGYSWGSDGRGIWVDHGCRADFAVGGGGGRFGQGQGYPGSYGNGGQDVLVSCSSDDMHRHYCPVSSNGRVQLVKQRSDSTCREGYSWGSDRQGIWVDHGCRADFQVVR